MMFTLASCQGLIDAVVGTNDNPAPQLTTTEVSDLLKQGVWTEYDTILVASGKNTMEELAEMPSVGMMVDGNKAYFFTYTAEGADDLVEGKVSYNKAVGTGSITFPAIKDNPLSGQTVSFTATSDEMLEFELTYGGVKTTATCAWLCENLDNWDTEGDEGDWKELLTTYYQNFPEDAGPDPSIDWSASEVEGLDQPLTWDDGTAATRGGTRMATAIIEGVSAGLEIFSSLLEEDPQEAMNAKLDAITGKLDKVLANQEEIKEKIKEVKKRLDDIANLMKNQETVESKKGGGAVYALDPTYDEPYLILGDPLNRNNEAGAMRGSASFLDIWIAPVMRIPNINRSTTIGHVFEWGGRSRWDGYNKHDWYMAIVAKRY